MKVEATCVVCGRKRSLVSRSKRCVHCIGLHTTQHADRALVPFEDDALAQRFVAEHPDGGTLEEVGQYFGITRERIRQIEAVALKSLLRACQREGLDAADLERFLLGEAHRASAAPPSTRVERMKPVRAEPELERESDTFAATAKLLDELEQRIEHIRSRDLAQVARFVREMSAELAAHEGTAA